MGQFEAMRSYFLLARGDFYKQFLDEVLSWGFVFGAGCVSMHAGVAFAFVESMQANSYVLLCRLSGLALKCVYSLLSRYIAGAFAAVWGAQAQHGRGRHCPSLPTVSPEEHSRVGCAVFWGGGTALAAC